MLNTPLDDSPESMGPALRNVPELRIFDSSDLPQYRGSEFASKSDNMVRARHFAEVSYSLPQSFDQNSKDSFRGKLKTGIFSGNWTLRDKKEMRPSVHSITVVPIRKYEHVCSFVKCALAMGYLRAISLSDSNHPSSATTKSQGSGDQASNCDSVIHRISDDTLRINEQLRNAPIRRRDSLIEYSKRRLAPSSQISNERSNNASKSLSQYDSRKAANSREIAVKLSTEQYSKSSLVDKRIHSMSFPMSTTNEDDDDNNSEESLVECGNKSRIDTKRTLGVAIQDELNGNGNSIDSTEDANSDNFDPNHAATFFDDSQSCRLRRIGGVKSVGTTRRHWHRPVNDVFPNEHSRSFSKDNGVLPTQSQQGHSTSSSYIPGERDSSASSPLSEALTRNLIVDADSAYRTATSESSPSSISSNNQSPAMRKSCPDLRNTTALTTLIQPKNLVSHRIPNQRNRRAREKRQAAEWMKKAVHEWSFDDVLLWLQYCKLDEVASIMIGYDINGEDVDKWDDITLLHLGIADESVRSEVLRNLVDAKKAYEKKAEDKDDKSARARQRMPLFKMVRSASYDKVLALETSLTTRDITVAEGRFGCLQVTKVNGANIPLKEQDCFLEINDKPGQLFRSALMFTKLISEAAGEPIRLVVLRRASEGDEELNENSQNFCYLRKNINVSEQDSSASSGISSSEVSSEIAVPTNATVDLNSEVLRL
ncbi:unnamed protein product [Anisakis simplex]|uniref:SAM domain-containing protein n=1 Tax=Anisakis simplex TaxID=6269 RepID=A0A158PNQ6_ANISI|nr:unnamed protein product [Anisakis simplex]